MNKTIHVLVSGASIAGLSTAYWLARYGFKVTVVERTPHLRPGGQALDVRGPALDIAVQMGILDAIRERSTKLTGMSQVDSSGKETFRSTERTLTGGQLDSADVEIMRDELCRVLHQAVDGGVEYLFDDSIAALAQDDAGVDVGFERAAPRRFDLVIGADGLHSTVRKLAFGPEAQFIRPVGDWYVAVFGMPNFLALEQWEVFYQPEDSQVGAMVMGLQKDSAARAYVGFSSPQAIAFDYRDIAAQKRLVAERVAGAGWVVPQIVEHMMAASDFHFDSMSQIRMDAWSRGRIVLVGDAGYSISPATGQGTTVAMIGAYVLAGELAMHKEYPLAGIAAYENALRDYVLRGQDRALASNAADPQAEPDESGGMADADFGRMVQPISLRNYPELAP
jgi:2-polyprenyl-6-methoxyphenol hydroxylase-like FAD-dependent oxidoreductase